jgi:hypothetical protein
MSFFPGLSPSLFSHLLCGLASAAPAREVQSCAGVATVSAPDRPAPADEPPATLPSPRPLGARRRHGRLNAYINLLVSPKILLPTSPGPETSPAGSASPANADAGEALPAGRRLGHADLLPGDILLVLAKPPRLTLLRRIIQFGQWLGAWLTGQSSAGCASIVHAAIWTRAPGSGSQAALEPQLVEAGGDTTWNVAGANVSPDHYLVYRPRDRNRGDWAAQVAMCWADRRQIRYNILCAALSAFVRPRYCLHAARRAAAYARQAFEPMPAALGGGVFCSNLVVACYDGADRNIREAAGQTRGRGIPDPLPLDAMHTTPSELEAFLRQSRDFEFIGYLSPDR